MYQRIAMEYIDNNAYDIRENPEGVDYDMWDCCFIQVFAYGIYIDIPEDPRRNIAETLKGAENMVWRELRQDISYGAACMASRRAARAAHRIFHARFLGGRHERSLSAGITTITNYAGEYFCQAEKWAGNTKMSPAT